MWNQTVEREAKIPKSQLSEAQNFVENFASDFIIRFVSLCYFITSINAANIYSSDIINTQFDFNDNTSNVWKKCMTIGHDTLSTPGGSMTFNFFFHSESAISSTPKKKNEWRHSLIVQYL